MVDFTETPGYVVDDQGRRQYANRDDPNLVPGTEIDAVDHNQVRNELVYAVKSAGLTPSNDDDTQLWTAISRGRLLRIVDVQWSQIYTPSSDARVLIVEIQGGGGGGGGAPGSASGSNLSACGSAGAAGGYAKIFVVLGVLPIKDYQLTVGAAGQSFRGAAGGTGGDTSFGSLVTCRGGVGGEIITSMSVGNVAWSGQSLGGDVSVTETKGMQVIDAYQGQNGMNAFLVTSPNNTTVSTPLPPVGASSPMGTGGGNGVSFDVDSQVAGARGFGAGGGGTGATGVGYMRGGSGAAGRILIQELG
ncbi:glycine-rich domain-containing protein [Acetobacter cibinongensis]|uniref:Glycine-rich domain-containing protein n=1 Tax=Acetobacter cibinongensis TaxID=146475 RepID=A0A1Z5YR80_9PROT|nr:hypothetical protein [Acetobacter cibinongensis]OUI98335.1 hypothetical protein HK14_15650 [Acetobacter cibinongensis]